MRWVLAAHVVAVISWMAGQLYLWRFFVYHAIETEPLVRARFEVMERRLLHAIATPAMLLTVATGATLLIHGADYFLHQPWMQAKLVFVALLLGCHLAAMHVRRRMIDAHAYDHRLLRVMNEVPTLLMVFIVIAVIVRPCAR
jgi:protoporphyrinogen IX oxidase